MTTLHRIGLRTGLAAGLAVLGGGSAPATAQTVRVALTFDDGPHDRPIYDPGNTTWKVRRILAANGIHATFFVEHSRINTANGAAQLRAAAAAGHEIGIHGANPTLQHQSWALTTGLGSQFQAMQRILRSVTGRSARYARPPGGESTLAADIRRGWVSSTAIRGPRAVPSGVTTGTVRAAVAGAGMTDYVGAGTSGWNSWLTSFTYGTFSPSTRGGSVVDEVVKKMDAARAGRTTERAIVLLHDAGGTAPFVTANLQAYLNELKRLAAQRGVRLAFGTMSEVAGSGSATTAAGAASWVIYQVRLTSAMNVRTGPGTNYASVGTLANGTIVDVYGFAGGSSWFKIWYGGGWRYVLGQYSVRVGLSVQATSNLNVRTGPGTGYAQVGAVPQYGIIHCWESNGGWYKVYYNGNWRWIYSLYTRKA